MTSHAVLAAHLDDGLADLSHLVMPIIDVPTGAAWTELRDVIETAIRSDPRSLQKRIGPSEIGEPCDRCLVSKLAGLPEAHDTAWLPYVGTCVHAGFAEVFAAANATLPRCRWLVELTVNVGEIDGTPITGHADLFDVWTGTVNDWKIVGANTLRDAKANGPSAVYRTQAHLYGRGMARRGLHVNRVQIAYLPRTSVTLADAYIWSEPYDEQVAVAALARADMFASAIRTFGVERVLATVPAHTGGSYGCAKRTNADGTTPTRPGSSARAPFADLLGG